MSEFGSGFFNEDEFNQAPPAVFRAVVIRSGAASIRAVGFTAESLQEQFVFRRLRPRKRPAKFPATVLVAGARIIATGFTASSGFETRAIRARAIVRRGSVFAAAAAFAVVSARAMASALAVTLSGFATFMRVSGSIVVRNEGCRLVGGKKRGISASSAFLGARVASASDGVPVSATFVAGGKSGAKVIRNEGHRFARLVGGKKRVA